MSNIADMIEAYILQRLAMEQSGQVEIRRTDIAEEISCAPSQISYVLSTRFTPQKGFAVESRRGLGGFIRIVQVSMMKCWRSWRMIRSTKPFSLWCGTFCSIR